MNITFLSETDTDIITKEIDEIKTLEQLEKVKQKLVQILTIFRDTQLAANNSILTGILQANGSEQVSIYLAQHTVGHIQQQLFILFEQTLHQIRNVTTKEELLEVLFPSKQTELSTEPIQPLEETLEEIPLEEIPLEESTEDTALVTEETTLVETTEKKLNKMPSDLFLKTVRQLLITYDFGEHNDVAIFQQTNRKTQITASLPVIQQARIIYSYFLNNSREKKPNISLQIVKNTYDLPFISLVKDFYARPFVKNKLEESIQTLTAENNYQNEITLQTFKQLIHIPYEEESTNTLSSTLHISGKDIDLSEHKDELIKKQGKPLFTLIKSFFPDEYLQPLADLTEHLKIPLFDDKNYPQNMIQTHSYISSLTIDGTTKYQCQQVCDILTQIYAFCYYYYSIKPLHNRQKDHFITHILDTETLKFEDTETWYKAFLTKIMPLINFNKDSSGVYVYVADLVIKNTSIRLSHKDFSEGGDTKPPKSTVQATHIGDINTSSLDPQPAHLLQIGGQTIDMSAYARDEIKGYSKTQLLDQLVKWFPPQVMQPIAVLLHTRDIPIKGSKLNDHVRTTHNFLDANVKSVTQDIRAACDQVYDILHQFNHFVTYYLTQTNNSTTLDHRKKDILDLDTYTLTDDKTYLQFLKQIMPVFSLYQDTSHVYAYFVMFLNKIMYGKISLFQIIVPIEKILPKIKRKKNTRQGYPIKRVFIHDNTARVINNDSGYIADRSQKKIITHLESIPALASFQDFIEHVSSKEWKKDIEETITIWKKHITSCQNYRRENNEFLDHHIIEQIIEYFTNLTYQADPIRWARSGGKVPKIIEPITDIIIDTDTDTE